MPERPVDLTPQVAAGVRLTTLQQGFEQVVRLLFTIVLARFVAPDDFGLMSMAFVVTYLAIMVSDLGVGVALVQRRDLRRAHITTAFTLSTLFGVALAALTVLTAQPVSAFFREPGLAQLLVVMSITFVCKGVQGVPRDLLRRNLRFVAYTVAAAVGLIAGVVAGTLAGAMGAGVWALVAYSVVESVVAMLLSLVFAWRARVWRPALGIERRALADLAGFAGYMFGARSLTYVQSTADNVVVGRMLGASALGFYGVAYRTMLVPVQKIADVVSSVAVPALAVMQDDVSRLRAAYLRAQLAAAVVSFPLSFGVIASSSLAIPVLLGANWVPAVGTVQILALNGPRLVIGRLASSLFQATGRPAWDFLLLLVSVPASIVAFVIGSRHGIAGVAIGLTIVGAAVLLVQLVLVARALATSIFKVVGNLGGVVSATTVMVLVVIALQVLLPASAPDAAELAVVVIGGGVAVLRGARDHRSPGVDERHGRPVPPAYGRARAGGGAVLMRALFVNENLGGHATVHLNLRRALRARPDVDARFYDVPAPGLVRKLAAAPVPGLAGLDAGPPAAALPARPERPRPDGPGTSPR